MTDETTDDLTGIVLPETLSDLVRQMVNKANAPGSVYKRKTDRVGYPAQWPDLTVMDFVTEWVTDGLASSAGKYLGASARGQYEYAPLQTDKSGPLSIAEQAAVKAARDIEAAEAALIDLERNATELRTRERDLADEVLARVAAAHERTLALVETVNRRHVEQGDPPGSDSKRRERLRRQLGGQTIAEGIRKATDRATGRR